MTKEKSNWSVLLVLSMAAFIMVIDSTAMNVSISNLVADLDTDISTIQMIMSLYTLIMAVFMLPGAKIADMFGKKKIFITGVCLYGVGTLTAALAVNAVMLFIGWALIEGLASAMMMPTALSLISSAYSGKQRAVAMSIYTAMSSVALAIGPIFGGLITTYLSWRFVFLLEVLIVLFIILKNKTIRSIDCPDGNKSERFDIPGTIFAGLGLLSIILGTLLSKTYGWFRAEKPFSIFGITIENISVTFILIVFGIAVIGVLIRWLGYAKAKGKPVLIDIAVFKSKVYDFVLLTNFSIQVCLMAVMFITSLYLQNIMRYSALSTGLTLMPLSLSLFVTALVAVKVTQKVRPNYVIAFGGMSIFCGALYDFIMFSKPEPVSGAAMIPAMMFLGIGIGCTLSLTGNIGLSDLDPKYSNQGSGMITTTNNFGSSMSTSVMGSIFTGGIAGSIASSFMNDYPQLFGGLSAEETAIKLSEAFQKFKVMGTETVVPAEIAEQVKTSVIVGVNNAARPIFIIIMAMSLLAAFIAFFLLKPKKHNA